jgi:hydroxyacylglutathione hydrolase
VPLDVAQLAGGPFAENTYVVRRAGAGDAVVIDPGWDAAEVRLDLARRGARCSAILITHGDLDHLAVVADLAEGTGAPVYIAEGDRERLERPNDFMPPGLPYTLRPWTPDVSLTGDETLELAGITWEVLRIPGHTAHHLAYAADGALFSGDLLFAGSVGRTDRPGDDWQELLASVRLLAERFPPETVVYPGHGPPTTLGRELDANPFLGELRAARQ